MSWRFISRDDVPDDKQPTDFEEIKPHLASLPPDRAIEMTVDGSPQSIVAMVSDFAIRAGIKGQLKTQRKGARVYIFRDVPEVPPWAEEKAPSGDAE